MEIDIKKLVLWIVIAILVIAVVYVLFIKGASSGSAIDAVKTTGQVASSSGMVGGC